jgi:hypothetical protein
MRLTIIADDGAIYTDNEFLDKLSFTNIPSNVHALQWDGTKGWIEFKENDDFTKPENQMFTELPTWVNDCLNDMANKKQQLIDDASIPVIAPKGTVIKVIPSTTGV